MDEELDQLQIQNKAKLFTDSVFINSLKEYKEEAQQDEVEKNAKVTEVDEENYDSQETPDESAENSERESKVNKSLHSIKEAVNENREVASKFISNMFSFFDTQVNKKSESEYKIEENPEKTKNFQKETLELIKGKKSRLSVLAIDIKIPEIDKIRKEEEKSENSLDKSQEISQEQHEEHSSISEKKSAIYESPPIKSPKQFNKEELKKIEDSINDAENNNYDVDFDDALSNQTDKKGKLEQENEKINFNTKPEENNKIVKFKVINSEVTNQPITKQFTKQITQQKVKVTNLTSQNEILNNNTHSLIPSNTLSKKKPDQIPEETKSNLIGFKNYESNVLNEPKLIDRKETFNQTSSNIQNSSKNPTHEPALQQIKETKSKTVEKPKTIIKKFTISNESSRAVNRESKQSIDVLQDKEKIIPNAKSSNSVNNFNPVQPSKSKINFFNVKMSDAGQTRNYESPNKTTNAFRREENKSKEKILIKPYSNYGMRGNNFNLEETKKKDNRNKTAKSCYAIDRKLKLESSKPRHYSTRKPNIKYEDQKRQFLQLMTDPRNPYSTNWSTKILERQYKVGITVNGFCNGVPVIKLVKKKADLPNINKKLNPLESPTSQPNEFNTNQKNFFKTRKDIQEGNPEAKYKKTRHNIGKIFINEFAKSLNIYNLNENRLCEFFVHTCVNPNKSKKLPPTKIAFFKPIGHMNEQGKFIKAIRDSFDPNFPVQKTDIGKVKFSLTGGDRYVLFHIDVRGHNGLKSLNSAFSSNDFEKIKIGIGRPQSKSPDQVADYVLKEFPNEHLEKIKQEAFPKIIKALNLL